MSSIRIRIANLLLSVQSPSALQRIEAFVQRELEQQDHNMRRDEIAAGRPTRRATEAEAKAEPKRKSSTTEINFGDDSEEWEDALATCDNILDSLDDLPERAEDFRESVKEKVSSIREWIEKNKEVTAAQLKALQNMEDGVARWQR